MEITSLGNGVVKVADRKFSIMIGPNAPKGANADVIALTEPSEDKPEAAMVLDGPGEYEVGGVLVTGIGAQLHIDEDGTRGTIYAVTSGDTTIAVLANIAPGLSDKQLEAMGRVDVLVVPVGGKGLTLDAAAAAQVVSQVEPKVIIPSHYDDGVSTYAMPQDSVDPFLKEIGAKAEETAKYKVNVKDIGEETAVVLLKPEK